MGDRYFWDNKCEKCGKISEELLTKGVIEEEI